MGSDRADTRFVVLGSYGKWPAIKVEGGWGGVQAAESVVGKEWITVALWKLQAQR